MDYPLDADEGAGTPEALACPVNFQPRQDSGPSADNMLMGLQAELDAMHVWHDLACEQSARTTGAASGLSVRQIKDFFADFIDGKIEAEEIYDQKVSDLLRRACEDLKAYYFKAVSAQPGQSTDVTVLADWFWGDTYAAACINEVRKICLTKSSKDMQLAGTLLLIPRNQMHRFDL